MGVDLADFKARLPIVDIIRRHVRLVRAGPLWKGLCPFHQEKTPSFTVTESRGTYHCFGCGAHGNAIDFLIAIEGLDFQQALTRAGELTGLEPPRADRPDAARAQVRALADVLEAANNLFRAAFAGAEGQAARAYVEQRGLTPASVARFELGYARGGRTDLTRALQAQSIGFDALVDAGLVVVPDDGREPRDRFRDRLMFPIRDGGGRLVGFGGRALRADVAAKYLNSPEGPTFRKRELLYGAHLLDRRAGRGPLYVVEGYMDVIALAEHGIAAVAPLGTAVASEQLEHLWRLEPSPIVCLDGDEAGLRAAGRLAEAALPRLRAGRTLRFAALPQGEDPDSLVRQGGATALTAVGDAAEPLVAVLWRWLGAAAAVDPDARALARRRLREAVASIGDRDVRREYGRALRGRLEGDDRPSRRWQRAGALAPRASLAADERIRAAELLVPLILEPMLLTEVEMLADLRFDTAVYEQLKECLLDLAAGDEPLETDAVLTHLNASGLGDVAAALASVSSWRSLTSRSRDEQVERYRAQLRQLELRRCRDAELELWAKACIDDEAGMGRYAEGLDDLLNSARSMRGSSA